MEATDDEPRKDVALLIFAAAKQGSTITYGELMKRCHIPRGHPDSAKGIGGCVGAVSEWTWENWRIYLSAIVVRNGTRYPAGGFFGLPGIPTKLRRIKSQFNDRLSKDDKTFAEKCQNSVFAWAARRRTLPI